MLVLVLKWLGIPQVAPPSLLWGALILDCRFSKRSVPALSISQCDVLLATLPSLLRRMQVGGILPRLEQCGMLSIELPIGRGPVGWLAGHGTVGALVGAPMHEPSGEPRGAWVQDTPIRPVKIVPITILRIPEIDACAAGGTPARRALAYDLLAAGHGHITDLSRPSLR